jgi:hypothetical protein
LKGAVRFIGIDPPKRHEPAPVLLDHLDRLPGQWRERADELRGLSAMLFEERGMAFCGDEDDLVPPSELFDRAEAEDVIERVAALVAMYRRLLGVPS